MKALSPGYLRVGGTLADRLEFVLPNVTSKYSKGCLNNKYCFSNIKPNFTMSGSWYYLLFRANILQLLF